MRRTLSWQMVVLRHHTMVCSESFFRCFLFCYVFVQVIITSTPPLTGRFGNGRVEGFLEGARDLSLDDMANSEISPKIAREMAKLHQLMLPPQLQAHYLEPGLWTQLWAWFKQAKGNVANLGSQQVTAEVVGSLLLKQDKSERHTQYTRTPG